MKKEYDFNNVIELGLTFPFRNKSLCKNIQFNKKILFTHEDNRWDKFERRTSFFKELMEVDIHSCTHVDALSHCAKNYEGFGGVIYDNYKNYKNTAEKIPTLYGKAVMLDIPKLLNKTKLDSKEEITVDMLQECTNMENTTLDKVSILLIRTGHINYWKNNDFENYLIEEPGININSAKWIASKGIKVVGSDNFGVEVKSFKEGKPREAFPVHRYLLAENGIYLVEHLDLDKLAENQIYSFYFIGAPIRYTGASGAFINPVAIV